MGYRELASGAILFHCLRQLGIHLPRDLSLLCIDVGNETMLLRITSYVFAVNEAVDAALSALLQPKAVWGYRGTGLRHIRVTGRIQQRATVRKLPQR